MTNQSNETVMRDKKKTTFPFSASNISVRCLALSIDIIYRHYDLNTGVATLVSFSFIS